MKKILAFLLLVGSLVFAEDDCNIRYGVQIHFLDSTIWYDDYVFSSGTYVVVADTLSEELEDGYKCFKYGRASEKAFLDSNVFLYTGLPPGVYPQDGEHILYMYSIPVATHGLGDVFRDEFLHWQQCGFLNMAYEDADSLIDSLVYALNDYDEGEVFQTSWVKVMETPFVYPDQIITWAKKACAKAPIAQVKKNGAAEIVLENGLAHIPERLIGQTYFIFDMNGRVIQQGIARETIRMPLYPVILKVGNEKPFLSKN